MVQCRARSKRTGQQCRRAAMRGRPVCLMHGGKSPRGMAAPNYQHGRYSTHLPTQWAQWYTQARQDPALTSLRDEIALAETRVHELLQTLPASSASPHTCPVWQAIGTQLDRLARLRSAEHQRLVDLRLMLSAEQGQALIGALVSIVMDALQKHIPDGQQVRRIYADISRGLDATLN